MHTHTHTHTHFRSLPVDVSVRVCRYWRDWEKAQHQLSSDHMRVMSSDPDESSLLALQRQAEELISQGTVLLQYIYDIIAAGMLAGACAGVVEEESASAGKVSLRYCFLLAAVRACL